MVNCVTCNGAAILSINERPRFFYYPLTFSFSLCYNYIKDGKRTLNRIFWVPFF